MFNSITASSNESGNVSPEVKPKSPPTDAEPKSSEYSDTKDSNEAFAAILAFISSIKVSLFSVIKMCDTLLDSVKSRSASSASKRVCTISSDIAFLSANISGFNSM